MQNLLGMCGCNCISCPTYKENIKTTTDRKKCSSGWGKYLKINLSPEKLRLCDGCSVPDSERKTYYLNCKIRKCAMINNIENCAYCSGFPCEEMLGAHSIQRINSREEYIIRTGKDISDLITTSLLNHIQDWITWMLSENQLGRKKLLITGNFLSGQNLLRPPRTKMRVLRRIYEILTTIGVEQDVSYARLQSLEKKREQFMKILWTMGCYGTYNNECGCLKLDAKTFLSQKIVGMYDTLSVYFRDFK